ARAPVAVSEAREDRAAGSQRGSVSLSGGAGAEEDPDSRQSGADLGVAHGDRRPAAEDRSEALDPARHHRERDAEEVADVLRSITVSRKPDTAKNRPG